MQMQQRRGASAEAAVLRLVQDHAAELLRFAARFSHCADDAHDAYQRTLEILVRRMRVEPPAQPLSWTRTVLRREALAVRAEREQLVGRFAVDADRHEGRHQEDPAERAVVHERLRQAAEALQRLKPQEVTALALRAEGLSYKEICSRTGWSYTRCNRAVTEGRRALAERLGEIRSGAECDRWAPLLSALADGEAGHRDLLEVRPHLRSCAGCRATLRAYHAAPAQVAALVPPALLPLSEPGGSLLGHVELALHALAERATLVAVRAQGAFDGMSGAKVAAVAASTAAIAGGGAAIEQATRGGGDAVGRDRGSVAAVAPAAAPALARIGAPGLMTIVDRSAASRRSRRSEFAAPSPRARAPEFARRPAAAAEFAPDPSAAAAAAAPAPAPAATPAPMAAPVPATPPSREPPEFFAP